MKNNQVPISAIIITKNNEVKLPDCLASLVWVNEVVVVDDFSSDRTPEICQEYGVRLVQHPFAGFQEQKRHATAIAAHDWILQLDADERVSAEMQAAIQALPPEDFIKFDCFEFRRSNWFWGGWVRYGSLYPDFKPRLFNRQKGAWGGVNPHDKFITSGVTQKIMADILHFQDWDLITYANRTIMYSDISAKEYFKGGKRTAWHHLTVRPVYTFFYRYFVRLAILDGWRGLVVSVMGALGTFVKYSRLYELSRHKSKSV
jgi:glycosyltransferase involved in cell wall biosynthesis